MPEGSRITFHVDGGARGNPGPAAIGAVATDQSGDEIERHSETIGEASNNVAEYRAMLYAAGRGSELGATELELVGDSELVVKQLLGQYKVKHPDMKQLYAELTKLLDDYESWTVRHIPREQNSIADSLVNDALDADG